MGEASEMSDGGPYRSVRMAPPQSDGEPYRSARMAAPRGAYQHSAWMRAVRAWQRWRARDAWQRKFAAHFTRALRKLIASRAPSYEFQPWAIAKDAGFGECVVSGLAEDTPWLTRRARRAIPDGTRLLLGASWRHASQRERRAA